ncbi:MAG: hypothetical protein AAF211_23655, partial [Myxococcota bacterium]
MSDLFARLEELRRGPRDPRDRAAGALDLLRLHLGAVAGTIVYASGNEEAEAWVKADMPGMEAWARVLKSTASEARRAESSIVRVYSSKRAGGQDFAVIAAPVSASYGETFGGWAILCRCGGQRAAERLKAYAQAVSSFLASALRPRSDQGSVVTMDDFTRVLAKAGEYRTFDAFAYAVTNAAKQRFGCEQAMLGRVERGQVRAVCVSGLDHVKRRSPGVKLAEQAMCECLDAGRPIVAQAASQWGDGQVAATGMLH